MSAALNWSDARRNDTIASQPQNKNGTAIVEIKYFLWQSPPPSPPPPPPYRIPNTIGVKLGRDNCHEYPPGFLRKFSPIQRNVATIRTPEKSNRAKERRLHRNQTLELFQTIEHWLFYFSELDLTLSVVGMGLLRTMDESDNWTCNVRWASNIHICAHTTEYTCSYRVKNSGGDGRDSCTRLHNCWTLCLGHCGESVIRQTPRGYGWVRRGEERIATESEWKTGLCRTVEHIQYSWNDENEMFHSTKGQLEKEKKKRNAFRSWRKDICKKPDSRGGREVVRRTSAIELAVNRGAVLIDRNV